MGIMIGGHACPSATGILVNYKWDHALLYFKPSNSFPYYSGYNLRNYYLTQWPMWSTACASHGFTPAPHLSDHIYYTPPTSLHPRHTGLLVVPLTGQTSPTGFGTCNFLCLKNFPSQKPPWFALTFPLSLFSYVPPFQWYFPSHSV